MQTLVVVCFLHNFSNARVRPRFVLRGGEDSHYHSAAFAI
jgi:hypothetical protein